MKIIHLFIASLLLSIQFHRGNETSAPKTYYAYASALERVKTDDPNKQNVEVYSNIVEYSCSHGHNEVARQFIQYYDAEIRNSSREMNYSTAGAWVYTSYDEAVAKRRAAMSKITSYEKRTVNTFYVTCK